MHAMNGHLVAGVPLLVAEPLVVAHVELPGREPHEAGNRPGLGVQAGRGLDAGRRRIGRLGIGVHHHAALPLAAIVPLGAVVGSLSALFGTPRRR